MNRETLWLRLFNRRDHTMGRLALRSVSSYYYLLLKVFLLWIDSASGIALEIELRGKSRYRGPSFLSLWSGILADEAEQAQRNQTSNWKLKKHASSKQTTNRNNRNCNRTRNLNRNCFRYTSKVIAIQHASQSELTSCCTYSLSLCLSLSSDQSWQAG